MFEKLDLQTPDFTEAHIAKLAELFPNCVTEAEDEKGRIKKAIDFDLLKQELSAHLVEGPKERYRLDWPGKRASLLKANTLITKTLRPAREESVNFDTTKNLYIEGDNLEALKLLQEAYLGKVKMIYIDPPYNTGKDFVYKDNFARSRKEELMESGQIDEERGKLVSNLESNGRFHSDWLSMMYPRLRLARNLLRDDGVIFISIDDNEVHNLRKICDEVFGEDNFITTFIWEKRTNRENRKTVSIKHDYVICYSRNKQSSSLYKLPMNKKALSNYKNPDNDPRGPWKSDPATAQAGHGTKKQFYDLIAPNGKIHKLESGRCWLYTEEVMKKAIDDNRIWFGKDGNGVPRIKTFLHEKERGLVPESILYSNDASTTEKSKNAIKNLFDNRAVFETPKPVELLYIFLKISTSKDDLILDFFSGSATTAHAVMQLNAEDGGNRRFIMVQLPEPTDPKSEAYKAGYKTIAEIGKERIRRAGRQIIENLELRMENEKENSTLKTQHSKLDIGFRVLKVDSSNVKDIYFTPDEVSKENLFETVDHIKEDRTPEDLLFGVLVDWGVDLSLPIRTKAIEGKRVYFVGHGDLAACFEEAIDESFVKTLAKKLAEEDVLRVVFKESGFADDNIKINTEQIFKQLAATVEVRVI